MADRQAFAGDDWLFPVQLSRVAGLTDHIKNGSVETSLVTFQGALKGFVFLDFRHSREGGSHLGGVQNNSVMQW